MDKKAEERQDPSRILGPLIETADRYQIINFLKSLTPVEVLRTISRLDKHQKKSLIELLGAERSADILSKISRVGDSGIFEHLSPSQAGPIFEEMSSHDQTGVLRKLKDDSAELILKDMKPTHADKLRQLMSYPENTAGGLMITEFLSYTSQPRVKDVLDDLQTHGEEYSDFDVQYAYGIILGCLLGVAALLWKGNPYLGLVVGGYTDPWKFIFQTEKIEVSFAHCKLLS